MMDMRDLRGANLSRRRFVQGLALAGAAATGGLLRPATGWAQGADRQFHQRTVSICATVPSGPWTSCSTVLVSPRPSALNVTVVSNPSQSPSGARGPGCIGNSGTETGPKGCLD